MFKPIQFSLSFLFFWYARFMNVLVKGQFSEKKNFRVPFAAAFPHVAAVSHVDRQYDEDFALKEILRKKSIGFN
jgi:hypothetical protein